MSWQTSFFQQTAFSYEQVLEGTGRIRGGAGVVYTFAIQDVLQLVIIGKRPIFPAVRLAHFRISGATFFLVGEDTVQQYNLPSIVKIPLTSVVYQSNPSNSPSCWTRSRSCCCLTSSTMRSVSCSLSFSAGVLFELCS
jgi:hypothetical protein